MTLSRRDQALSPRTSAGSSLDPLPIRSEELLTGWSASRSLEYEKRHGNSDLIRAVDILGIGGPFRVVNPWVLEDPKGRRLINAGGYAALPFGEAYPPLVHFLTTFLTQNREMGLPQQSASAWRAALETNLIALLAREAPSHADSGVFFANSGAEAVETAIKFARAARPRGKLLLNFTAAYHGKTMGALALTPNESYQAPFKPLMPGVLTLPFGDANALERAILEHGGHKITAVILEPIQGEAGVIVPPPEFLPAVAELARRHDLLVIADEVQTGLGRSGHHFASVAAGLEPDIITLAKPLGGGLVPVGATIARRSIFRKALGGTEAKRHSNTFGGGSLAMAVALRSLELLVEEGLAEKARRDGEVGLARLEEIRDRHPRFIRAVRGTGMLFAIQLQPAIRPFLLSGRSETLHTVGTGLAVRELHLGGVHVCFALNASNVLRMTPALNIPPDLFAEMFARIELVARRNRAAWHLLPRTPLSRLLRLARLAVDG